VEKGRGQNLILYRPVIPIIRRRVFQESPAAREATIKAASRNPFRLFLHPDILLLLALNAIINAIFFSINTSISALFSAAYPFLNETTIGLCYLAIGGGMVLGSSIIGRILDWEYRTFQKRAELRIMALELTTADITKENIFSLEQVRR
jgi:predicted MFS family arabinose efflux permease